MTDNTATSTITEETPADVRRAELAPSAVIQRVKKWKEEQRDPFQDVNDHNEHMFQGTLKRVEDLIPKIKSQVRNVVSQEMTTKLPSWNEWNISQMKIEPIFGYLETNETRMAVTRIIREYLDELNLMHSSDESEYFLDDIPQRADYVIKIRARTRVEAKNDKV